MRSSDSSRVGWHDFLMAHANPWQQAAATAILGYENMIERAHEGGVGYVPCPRCILDRSFVVPQHCDKSSHLSDEQCIKIRETLATA